VSFYESFHIVTTPVDLHIMDVREGQTVI